MPAKKNADPFPYARCALALAGLILWWALTAIPAPAADHAAWFEQPLSPTELSALLDETTVPPAAASDAPAAISLGELAARYVEHYDLRTALPAANIYTDLTEDEPYAEDILRLAGLGYIKGVSATVIGLDRAVSHERALVIYARLNGIAMAELSYGGPGTGSAAWAQGFIDALTTAGVLGQEEHGALYIKNAGPEASAPEMVARLPYVTEEMHTAAYWSERLEAPDEVLLTPEQIQDLNARILLEEATCTNDLAQLPATVNGTARAQSWSAFAAPAYPCYQNGVELTAADYDAIRANITAADTAEDQPLLYGIGVTRTEMKSIPAAAIITDDLNDPEYDDFMNSVLRVNEPVAIDGVTADQEFYHVISHNCSGWVPARHVAVCASKAEWLAAQTYSDRLVITGDRVYLEPSAAAPELSGKMLTMGTVLQLVTGADKPDFIDHRSTAGNYVVKMPGRTSDGRYAPRLAMIPVNRDVSVGYLPLTSANLLSQAFKMLGNRFGWGGMLDAWDCSLLVHDLYLCFGLDLPRNTTWQAAMPVNVVRLTPEMSAEEKIAAYDGLLPGALLNFADQAHVALYLGSSGGRHYALSAVGSLVNPLAEEQRAQRYRSVLVKDLSVLRGNGLTWFDSIGFIIKIYEPAIAAPEAAEALESLEAPEALETPESLGAPESLESPESPESLETPESLGAPESPEAPEAPKQEEPPL